MNRQSGLGRGLAALLPPAHVYETPKKTESLSVESAEESQESVESESRETPEQSSELGSIAGHTVKSSTIYTEESPKTILPTPATTTFMEESSVTTLFSRLLDDLTSDSPGISVVYKALSDLVDAHHLDDAVLVVDEAGLGRQVFTFDRRPLSNDDEKFLTSAPGLYTSPQIDIPDADAQTLSQLCAVGLRIDLLKYDAWHDPLTGLYDRRSFDRLLEMAVARSVRYQWPFTLVLIDLDGFKELNDEQGHQAGDQALRSLGDRFRRILRFGDNCARIGGDEFAVILPETEPEDVPPLLERIAMVNGDEPAIGFSYGLALCPSEADGIDSLFKLADERLYEAKNQRKND